MEKAVKEKAMTKKNKVIIISGAIAVVAIIATLFYFLALKPTYDEAIVNYDTALTNYNKVVSEYETKKGQIEAENEKLNVAIDELQSVVSSGEKPYNPDTIPASNSAINEGKIALVEIPVWEYKGLKKPSDYNVLQAFGLKGDVDEVENFTSELTDIVKTMQIPDYSTVLKTVNDAKATLEHSIKQLKQVTCPSESFVLQRVTNIRDEAGMKDVISLTEDNDPENYIGKAGWYTTKVIFHHRDVEHYGLDSGLLTLSEVGNPAGGCVEVYRTEDDAQRRADELKGQEGTSRSPGARMVCGTVVIRVSDDLKTSYQQKLLEMISAELLRVEE